MFHGPVRWSGGPDVLRRQQLEKVRQENAQLATVEKGEELFTRYGRFVAATLQKMIDATESG